MLLLYLFLLGALALVTAYTRNFQRTLVELGSRIGESASAGLIRHGQRLRTMALLAGWPGAVGFGMMLVAWWKAVALALRAFVILVPVLGALTPRPESHYYLDRIRADLRARIANGGGDVKELAQILARLDELSQTPPT
jgi:hypothetical protein